jgi:putative endonuclease
MSFNKRNTQATGMIGETQAIHYLKELGYRLLHRNWRYGRYEVDLISSRDGIIHFFEVKTRRTLRFGWPEEHVKKRKIRRMMSVAEAYLQNAGEAQPVQLNIMSIVLTRWQPPVYLIEDISTF